MENVKISKLEQEKDINTTGLIDALMNTFAQELICKLKPLVLLKSSVIQI